MCKFVVKQFFFPSILKQNLITFEVFQVLCSEYSFVREFQYLSQTL